MSGTTGRHCTGCAAALPEEARFCFSCGLPVAAPTCAACGTTLVLGARFCMICGTPQQQDTGPPPQVASRRVTSILFGDLVGFTSLSESRDQEEVRELLSRYFDECRRVISRYGGTVEKFIGDAVMALWGVPAAHEDDAERAVRAGLELVTAVAEFGEDVGAPGLAMRVGVVTGEVAVTVGATQQGMVAGDAVNTAARVQSVATPGSVWVDETTRLLTTAAITYADAGSHLLKGKTDPVPLWSVRAVVAAVGGAQRADGLEAPLVGRERELRLVKELFHHCEESGRPTLLVIDGEPGVGKSRLGWEFEKYVDGLTTAVRWHSGRCVAYGEGVAYYALAEAVRGRLQALTDTDASEDEGTTTLLDRGLEHFVADAEERAWVRERLGALLGVGSVGTFAREDLFSAWVTFLQRVGGDDPVTLLVDDAQHADEGLLTFIEHLLTSGSFACFVVLLTRPGLLESRPALATHRQANVVHLPTLNGRDVARMLDGLVAGLPDTTREALVARSEGVPLFAVETVRSLIDRDLVVPRGGQYVLAPGADEVDLDALAAPASLQALIAARLDALTPEQRTLLDRASVLGMSFPPEAVAGLCSDLADPERVLAELVRLQLLSRESSRMSSELGHFRFVQSAVRQVAYGTLSRRDRKWIHLAVVDQFERLGEDGDDAAAIRAQHYLEALAAVPGDDDVTVLRTAALDNLRRAAERSRALGSPGEAARHLAAAMPLADEPSVRGRLGCELANAEADSGSYDAATAHAREAQELLVELGDRIGAGYAAAVIGSCLTNGYGSNEQALAETEPWWEELAVLEDVDEATETLSKLGRVVLSAMYRLKRDFWQTMEVVLRLAERTGSAELMSTCYSGLSVHYANVGAMSLSGVLLEAAAGLARRHRDIPSLSLTLINLTAHESPRDLPRAVELATEAISVSIRGGIPWLIGYAHANHALAVWGTGDWDAIIEPDSKGRQLAGPDLDVTSAAVAALRARARGTTWVDVSLAHMDDVDDDVVRAWTAFLSSVEARLSGDSARALTLGMESVELLYADTGVWDDLCHVWGPVTEVARELADETAMARLLAILEENRSHLPTALLGHRAHLRGALAVTEGRDDEVEPAMTDALEAFAAWGSPPAGARARADLGRWLVTRGRLDEGREMLDAARATYDRLGARRWLEELDGAPAAPPGDTIDDPSAARSLRE